MKRTLLLGSVFLASNAIANSGTVNQAASMTTGPSSNSYNMSAGFNNPAMTPLMINTDESIRTTYFPSFGMNFEIGQVDNFIDDIEELTDILDDPSSSNQSTQEVLDRFNSTLVAFGEDGYLKNSISLTLPFFPLLIKSDFLGGSLGLSMYVNATAGISFLDDPLQYNNQTGSFTTATSLYLKSGVEKTVALAYGREMPLPEFFTDHGNLFAGVKLKAMNIDLSKQVIPLETLDSNEIEDLIVDEYDRNQVSTTELGVDLGLVWDGGGYRVGLTFENLNSPEFEYGEVGRNCTAIAQNTPARSSCEAAAYFADVKGEIKTKEVHVKDPVMRGDILLKLTERWQLTSSMDFAEYNDVIGFDNQWIHVATSYDADSWWIPSTRIGYHKNLVGTETSSASLGFTLFNTVALDLEYGLDTTEIDGNSAPRRLGFGLSIEESF